MPQLLGCSRHGLPDAYRSLSHIRCAYELLPCTCRHCIDLLVCAQHAEATWCVTWLQAPPETRAQAMLQDQLPGLLPDVFTSLKAWTVQTRLAGARLLQSVLVLAQAAAAQHLQVSWHTKQPWSWLSSALACM